MHYLAGSKVRDLSVLENGKGITILKHQKNPNRYSHVADTDQLQPEGDGTCGRLEREANAGVKILQFVEFVDQDLFRICRSNRTQSTDGGICVTDDLTSTYFCEQNINLYLI